MCASDSFHIYNPPGLTWLGNHSWTYTIPAESGRLLQVVRGHEYLFRRKLNHFKARMGAVAATVTVNELKILRGKHGYTDINSKRKAIKAYPH